MGLRFGVVGTSYWASEVHLPGLLQTEGATVGGVWGRTTQTVTAIAARHDIRAFARFEDLLDAVDAVSMAVPPAVQAGLGLAAVRAGKHLILEKPLATDHAAADAIAAAVEQTRRVALVFFMRRFVPEIAAAIATERAHDWTHADVRVHSAALSTNSPYARSIWRQATGAALWDIGPHVLSILIPMLGRVVRVEARGRQDDVTTFRTTHMRGATADVSVSLHSMPGGLSNSYRFTSATRNILLPDPEISRVGTFARAAGELIAMVGAGRVEHECGVKLGAEIVGVLAAAEASFRTGAAIAIVGE